MSSSHCVYHSGFETSIKNIENDITEIKHAAIDDKKENTDRRKEIYKRIEAGEKDLNDFKTKIGDRVGKIDKKAAFLYGVISVGSWFIFELLKFIGTMLIKGMK